MGNTRSWTREFNARRRELSSFVKAKAGRSEKARKDAIKAAANGRPAELPQIARAAVASRRAVAMVERLQGGGQ
jgi:hypothetical protein